MSKIQKKIKQLHKTKVHHNRWLIWTVALALISTIALVGHIKISEEYFGEQVSKYNEIKIWKTYTDSRLGFSMDYPNTWAIEALRNGIEFSDPKQAGNGILVSVYDPKDEESVLSGINKVSEELIKIGELTGIRYTDAISKDVTEEVVLVVNNNRLYSIRGSGKIYNKALASFKLN